MNFLNVFLLNNFLYIYILDLIFFFIFMLSFVFLILDFLFTEDSKKETLYNLFFCLFMFALGYIIGRYII